MQLTLVNNYLGNIYQAFDAVQLGMNVKNIRLINLRRLIKTSFAGNAGQCADKLEIKRPQLNRWVTPNEDARQGISEESARTIEKKLGLQDGYLDKLHGSHVTKINNNWDKIDWLREHIMDDDDIRKMFELMALMTDAMYEKKHSELTQPQETDVASRITNSTTGITIDAGRN